MRLSACSLFLAFAVVLDAGDLGIAVNGVCEAGICPGTPVPFNTSETLPFDFSLTLPNGDMYRIYGSTTTNNNSDGAGSSDSYDFQVTYEGNASGALPSSADTIVVQRYVTVEASASSGSFDTSLIAAFSSGIASSSSVTTCALSSGVCLGPADPPASVDEVSAAFNKTNIGGTFDENKTFVSNFGAGSPAGSYIVWGQDTAISPPALSAPALISPANGSVGVLPTPTLKWSPVVGATSYDVYFGTSATPSFVTNTTLTSYSTGALSAATTYYWNIVARNGTGTSPSATWSFTTAATPSIAPTALTPATGSGFTQTFTFNFTDPAGYMDLAVLDVLINNYLDGIGACYLALVPASSTSGYLYLVDNAGDGGYVTGTPLSLPSSGSLANSQCTINGAGSSVSASGNTLILTLNITFASAFAGDRIFYTAARSATQNSGWQALGTWNVPAASVVGPGVGGVTPGRSVSKGQNYTFTFTDSTGFAGLAVLDILTNSFLDGIDACYIAYVPTSATNGYVYLVDNAGDGGYAAGSPISLSSGGTLSNSQCTINTAGSSASASGDSLNLDLALTFSSSFTGNQVFYLASRNSTTGNSGWQPAGSVTVP
ncbi:MAG TPA: hypothetical protein VGG72_01315 [Bryobacteraceae bacterium]|jgi:hypothetical protein